MEILPQLFVNALISGSIYALAGVGLALAYGLLRVLNFAHGHLMMVGAYLFYFFSVQLGYSLPVSALGTAVGAVIVGWLSLEIFIVPFYRYGPLLTFITSLCLSNILEAGISMLFGVNVKSLTPGAAAQSIEIGSVYITPIQIVIILSAIIILSLIALVIHSSSFGLRVRAMAESPESAESLGISRRRMSFIVFVGGTLLAAYAGVMVGYETNMQPTMGTSYTVKAFAAMILGGLGNIWGTVVGSYILGFVENFAIGLDFGGYSVPAGYKDAFAFVIILLVLLFRPQGLFGTRGRKA